MKTEVWQALGATLLGESPFVYCDVDQPPVQMEHVMPLSSWQLCLLSDRISVIKRDSLSFLTETLKVSFAPSHRLHIRSTLDLSIRHVWMVVLLTARCCGDAVDKRLRGRLLNLTLAKAWELKTARHDWKLAVTLMGHNRSKTAMSCCGSARETASESLRDELRWHYTHQAQWQLWWIGFVAFFFSSHNSFCPCRHWAAVDGDNECRFGGLLNCFCSLILVQMNSVHIWVQCF